MKPDGEGRITAQAVLSAVREDTALVSVMLVNNETGAVFPVEEIAAGLRDHPALLHTDAVQGFLKIPFTAKGLGADYITLSAHKVGGPKGIGALYAGGRAKNVGLHVSGGIALPLQLPDALEHGAVLHGGGDDVFSYPAVLVEGGPEGPVVSLGAAGGKEDLFRLCPQGPGDGGPAMVHNGFGLPAGGVLGGGVAEVLRQRLQHGLRRHNNPRNAKDSQGTERPLRVLLVLFPQGKRTPPRRRGANLK